MKQWLRGVGLLILALVLVIGVWPVQAQNGTTPTVLVQTKDGKISFLVPDGWFYYDNSGDQQLALFSSMLFFGENEREIEARLNINRGLTDRVNGFGGVVALVDSSLYQQAFGAAPNADDLMQLLIDSNVAIGATTTETTEVAIMGVAGKLVIIDTSAINNEVSIVVTFDTTLGTAVGVSSGPLSTFSANINLLGSILDTIVIPAGSAPPPTQVGGEGPGLGGGGTTTGGEGPGLGGGSGSQPPASETVVFAASNGEVSIELPPTWVIEDRMDTTDRFFVFGDSQAAVNSRLEDFIGSGETPVVGLGGYVALVDYAAISMTGPAPTGFARAVLENLAPTLIVGGGELLTDIQDAPDGVNSAFVLFVDSSGEYGVAVINVYDEVSAFGLVLFSSDDENFFRANPNFAGTITGSVRVPGQPPTNNLPPATGGTPEGGLPGLPGLGNPSSGLPGLPGLGNQTPAIELGLTVFNPERTFAFDMPTGWQISEIPLPSGYTSILYFGADMPSINGFGNNANQNAAGAYFLQPRANLDRGGTLDVEQLFSTILGNATFTTIETRRGLVNGRPAFWAEGTLGGVHGYWALIDFDSQVAVFILTTPEAKWTADEPYLSAIFNSARFNPQGLE